MRTSKFDLNKYKQSYVLAVGPGGYLKSEQSTCGLVGITGWDIYMQTINVSVSESTGATLAMPSFVLPSQDLAF